MSTDGERGFSLMEVLIALAIFAILAVMSFEAILITLSSESRLKTADKSFTDVERAYAMISRDLREIVSLNFASPDASAPPSLLIRADGSLAEFLRAGIANPMGAPRPSIMRAGYRWTKDKDGVLERLEWPSGDDATDIADARRQTVLAGVTGFQMRAWSPETGWTKSWGENEAGPPLPEGIEVKLDTTAYGPIRIVVALK